MTEFRAPTKDRVSTENEKNEPIKSVSTKSGRRLATTSVLIAFGSNLGETDENVRAARRLLAEAPGVRLLRTSSIWRTFPVGGPAGQPSFSNAVATAETTLEPLELLRTLQEIERKLRRVRRVFWGPRTIDVDLILFGDVVETTSELTVPHPRAVWRNFVLDPACEIAAERRFPTTGLTIREHRALLYWNFRAFESFSYWIRRTATTSRRDVQPATLQRNEENGFIAGAES